MGSPLQVLSLNKVIRISLLHCAQYLIMYGTDMLRVYDINARVCLRPSSCKNTYFRLSVCLSVRLSHLFDNVPVIVSSWNFQELFPLTDTMSMQDQWSKVKVTEVMSPFSRFRTVTPVWIHIWGWNDAQSLMLLRSGTLLFFKVIRQISRSHG